ncbi:nose resistant to fluoxetine protein 6-like [Argiope bruennichi]|uniref:nose resistant to fluoxetine protein 6-like n=1 Tax=Argiope bruennichi TaxID=94029 RepID=UPI002494F60A|nr:nose resistant to fluoxetine protein 6-like [Argiope bruennichi]
MNKSESEIVHEKWQLFEKTVKKIIDGRMKKALPMFLRMSSDAKLSGECQKSIMALVNGVRSLKSWAFRMLDASAKPPSGVLDGTLTDFGDYDQCLAVEKLDNKKKVQFTGQYCVVEAAPILPSKPHRVQFKTVVLDVTNFSHPDSVLSDFASNANMFYLMKLRLGLCLPSTCSISDVQEVAKLALKDVPLEAEILRCEVKEPYHLSNLQIAVICILGFVVILVIVGTYIDTSNRFNSKIKESGIVTDSLKCFSVNKNLAKLFRISQSKENFGVLNGMRVLSMVWIVLSHTYGFNHKQSYGRMKNAQGALEEVTFGTIINAWVIVDTFFVLGAFLVAHSNLKALDKKNGRLNFLRYYLHRIWRLTPPVAGVLLIMFILPLLGSGPLWKDVIGKQVGNCEKYWWQALIIPINTWTHFEEMCLLHTWYIASDLHLYCVAPLILIPLYKWPMIGFLVMLFLTVCCMGIVAAVTIANDLYPTLLYFTPDEKFTYFLSDLVYFRPYPHMGAYCVGLALGYFVLNHRKINMKPAVQVLGWCAAIACNLAVLYGAYEWNRGNLPTKVVDVTYAMFHRTAWAFGIAWVIFICITGRGGLVNRFLSWDLFVPLGRLSYSTYILHFPVLWVRCGLRRQLLHFHHYDIFYEFLATLFLTLCLAVTFHLLFEAPFLNLEEVWFPRHGKSKEKEKRIENGTTIVPVAKMEDVVTNGHTADVFSVRL